MNTAYEVMLSECENGKASAVRAMQNIAHSAGINGMINGQVRDIKISEKQSADEDELLALIEQKTMAMIMTIATTSHNLLNFFINLYSCL